MACGFRTKSVTLTRYVLRLCGTGPIGGALRQASAYANVSVKHQQEVTSFMRTELDRIAENEYARKEGREEIKAL